MIPFHCLLLLPKTEVELSYLVPDLGSERIAQSGLTGAENMMDGNCSQLLCIIHDNNKKFIVLRKIKGGT
jgi:hypothetical protein